MDKELKIRKLIFLKKFLDSVNPRDRLRLELIQRHHMLIRRDTLSYTLTHLNITQDIYFFNQTIKLIPYFISGNDIYNTGKSQYITGPAYNFEAILNKNVIEIEHYKDASHIEKVDVFINHNYKELIEATNKIKDTQRVLFIGPNTKAKDFSELITFDKYKKK